MRTWHPSWPWTWGVCISNGSACNSEPRDPSHVLLAMGVAPALARSAIRISIGRTNTTEDVDKVARILAVQLERIRGN